MGNRIWTPFGATTSLDAFVVIAAATHPRNLTLHLWAHLKMSGQLSTNDGTTECSASIAVQIQRHRRFGWHTVRTKTTQADGTYMGRIADRAGTYRAKVVETTLPSGDVCKGAISGTRHYQRRP